MALSPPRAVRRIGPGHFRARSTRPESTTGPVILHLRLRGNKAMREQEHGLWKLSRKGTDVRVLMALNVEAVVLSLRRGFDPDQVILIQLRVAA